jgi:lactoylglutathione lyase
LGEHARLSAIGGIDLDPEPMRTPGAPLMFVRDGEHDHADVREGCRGLREVAHAL